ncbi:MAG: chlorophyll synthase ChlG [Burkholderiaceae bacterium]|jgi:chlorophyll synthase|nr:chlorophyll synthase ChlG [Betaproteobacteria bacterium]MDC1458154.1 chlorophyll synthase ChlG [Burkholderiaceae bacterium]MDG1108429.1 chlorophyll synthase ChlG [Burkholderiaceae bacterium]MDG1382870.1 chlorophyll synthase ChlG [Burkholderiaceae bacterium]MDO7552660.1 chlorophyll synthase ChlG [Burkholderiaceae bacterium]
MDPHSLAFADTPRTPSLRTVAELLKPITWFPPVWAFACGTVASGQSLSENWLLILLGLVLTGPLVCASSQAVNDWFDRHVDAINEPQRPIPSGRMPGRWGLGIAIFWTVLSLAWATLMGPWGFAACALAITLSWAYSMPPVRLKNNGWFGNAACALSYEGLAWLTGAAVMLGGAWPTYDTICLALLYSVGAHGIMTLNDFKAIEGDRQMGVASLPVQLGAQGAARVACWMMWLPQVAVAALLWSWALPWHALAVLALSLMQWPLMATFLKNPIDKALQMSAFGVPLFVSGMMVSAWGLRQLSQMGAL